VIPGGTELLVIALVGGVVLAGPKVVPAVVNRGAATLEETRAAVDGAVDGSADGETEGGR